MREKYESLALAQLKELAKVRGIKNVSTMKKAEIVEAMLVEDEKDKPKSEPTRVVTTRQTDNSRYEDVLDIIEDIKTGINKTLL